MITVTIFQNKEQAFTGFECIGHAGYAPKGEDIICAGVSALVINTVNSLANFTKVEFTTDMDEETGKLTVLFQTRSTRDSDLLMRSLVLGLQGIQNSYGNEYIHLEFKEV